MQYCVTARCWSATNIDDAVQLRSKRTDTQARMHCSAVSVLANDTSPPFQSADGVSSEATQPFAREIVSDQDVVDLAPIDPTPCSASSTALLS